MLYIFSLPHRLTTWQVLWDAMFIKAGFHINAKTATIAAIVGIATEEIERSLQLPVLFPYDHHDCYRIKKMLWWSGSNSDALHCGTFIIATIATISREWFPFDGKDCYNRQDKLKSFRNCCHDRYVWYSDMFAIWSQLLLDFYCSKCNNCSNHTDHMETGLK